MTSEQLYERLTELGCNPFIEWTDADYLVVLEAYNRADQATKDQVWALLQGSETPRRQVD